MFLTLTQSLFAYMYLSKRVSIKPQDFVKACTPEWFQFGHQQDSSEFLIYLLDNLNEQFKYYQKSANQIQMPPPSLLLHRPIESLFGCRLSTECICFNCKTKTTRNDLSFMIPLSFPDTTSPSTATTTTSASPLTTTITNNDISNKPLISVQSLIDKFFQAEELNEEGNNLYSCNKCNSLQNAHKTHKFLRTNPSVGESATATATQLPEYIIFTLNRFQYETNRTTNEIQQRKIMTKLDYNQTISINTYNESDLECECAIVESYLLIAVVVHSGSSLHHGHYYSYINELNEIDNGNNDIDTLFANRSSSSSTSPVPPTATNNTNWLLINDEQITRITNETFLNNQNIFKNDTPYVLFYRRLNTSPRSPSTSSATTNQIDVKNKRLIDQITIDNSKYLKEIEEKRLKRRIQTTNNKSNKFIKTKNNDDDGSNDDDDEQPPSYCNNNSHIDNGPRFVY